MPPKKPAKPLTASQPVHDLEPMNKFLDAFKDLIKQWYEYYVMNQEINVRVLKDGKYIEEIPEEVVVEQEIEKIDMAVKRETLPPSVSKKEFSEEFTEEELMNLRLEDCGGIETPPPTKINLGLGFNKDGIFSKIQIEEATLPAGFIEVFRVIRARYASITKLHLIDCNLRGSHVTELGKFLRDYQTIIEVNLDVNPIHDQSFHVLIRQTGVQHLSLKNCKIDCFGAKMISRGLIFEPGVINKLLSLDLTGNMIHDEGLAVLAQALRTNFTLQFLSVSKNLISTNGVLELSKILQRFPLTHSENLERRYSYIKYIEEMAAKADDSLSLTTNISSGTEKRKSTSSSRQKQKSIRSLKLSLPKEEIAVAAATDMGMAVMLCSNLHPLLATTFEENGIKYSVGNFTLRYINLSYNWFGKIGLEALVKAVEYQVALGPQKSGPGLFYIDVEGLYMSDGSGESEKLKDLLAGRYVPPSLDKRNLFLK